MTILGKDYTKEMNEQLKQLTLEPFITKSDQWSYEEEVRCLLTSSSKTQNLIKDDDQYFYKMPNPTKIYVGCRAKGQELASLSKLAKRKGIKLVFLKEDDDTFSLREKQKRSL